MEESGCGDAHGLDDITDFHIGLELSSASPESPTVKRQKAAAPSPGSGSSSSTHGGHGAFADPIVVLDRFKDTSGRIYRGAHGAWLCGVEALLDRAHALQEKQLGEDDHLALVQYRCSTDAAGFGEDVQLDSVAYVNFVEPDAWLGHQVRVDRISREIKYAVIRDDLFWRGCVVVHPDCGGAMRYSRARREQVTQAVAHLKLMWEASISTDSCVLDKCSICDAILHAGRHPQQCPLCLSITHELCVQVCVLFDARTDCDLPAVSALVANAIQDGVSSDVVPRHFRPRVCSLCKFFFSDRLVPRPAP
jgi:hypothetical protein